MNDLGSILSIDQLISIFGVAILLTILLYLTFLIIAQIKTSIGVEKLQEKELGVLVERSERILASVNQDIQDENGAWQGQRKFEIRSKVLEADSIRSFYLTPHDGKPLPPFRPGQFLTFYLKIPGTKTETTVRCYSLSDAPTHEDYYRVSIKQLGPPPKNPDVAPGLSSNFFHDNLQTGDILDVMAPGGDFFLDTETDSPVVLIGAGIGLTPVVSMLNYIVDTESTRETWFFYGMRNGTEHVWKDHLKKLNAYPNINVVICYSDPTEDDKQGEDYDVQGWVGVPLFKEKLSCNNYNFYICGPPPMMNAVVNDLDEWGVPEEHVHFEAFGPASVKKKGDEPKKSTEEFDVEFSRTGKTVKWTGEHNSLAELAEENDIVIPPGCRAGNCGACKTALRSGDVAYSKKPSFRYEKGSCLVCCSTPKGPITLDA